MWFSLVWFKTKRKKKRQHWNNKELTATSGQILKIIWKMLCKVHVYLKTLLNEWFRETALKIYLELAYP